MVPLHAYLPLCPPSLTPFPALGSLVAPRAFFWSPPLLLFFSFSPLSLFIHQPPLLVSSTFSTFSSSFLLFFRFPLTLLFSICSQYGHRHSFRVHFILSA
ncbi:hypothetical protein F5Y17DRAFT_59663 [Xylariaceae sp. FL0594]|nr:hypothetical protein F5Y17DRAFT_59663 [Xylariaceae sp. FL0594]